MVGIEELGQGPFKKIVILWGDTGQRHPISHGGGTGLAKVSRGIKKNSYFGLFLEGKISISEQI